MVCNELHQACKNALTSEAGQEHVKAFSHGKIGISLSSARKIGECLYVCVVGVHVEEDAENDSQIQVKDRCSLRNDKTLPFRQHLIHPKRASLMGFQLNTSENLLEFYRNTRHR